MRIAEILRASLATLPFYPLLHGPEEDLAFVRNVVLAQQSVTLACSGAETVGFISSRADWIEQLYIDPVWIGHGIGSLLLRTVTAGSPISKLYCFQANTQARRFYERHGYRAEAVTSGENNEEHLPDILYVLRR